MTSVARSRSDNRYPDAGTTSSDHVRLERSSFDALPELQIFGDHTIQQSREWIAFIAQTQRAEPIFARVMLGDRVVGRFTGLITGKSGMRILGSPFPGWTTSYLGFNLEPGVSRVAAVQALERFAFQELSCVHFEMMDRNLSLESVQELGYHYRVEPGFEIDLTRAEGDIFNAMTSACRRAVRRAGKLGLTIEASDASGFVDDYYAQLEDVFAKQNLVPTYAKDRVDALIEHLMPTGRLLLVRAVMPDGTCAGTSIFPAMNDTMFFWGGASWRAHQNMRPNEAMMWFAMRYWRDRGITRFDMGGGSEYKRKYGGAEIGIPWIRKSKYAVLESMRGLAKDVVAINQRIRGALRV